MRDLSGVVDVAVNVACTIRISYTEDVHLLKYLQLYSSFVMSMDMHDV